MTNDTISRAAALSALNGLTEIYLNNLPPTIYKSDAVDAIKALPSAQPVVISKSENTTECEDAVNRKELHRLFEDQWHYLQCLNWSENPKAEAIQSGVNWCINTLHDMPSVTPKQPGWIPCTPETMPEKTDTYLVQVGINKNGEGMHTEVRTAVWNVIWQKWYVHTTHCFVGDIIKWMPIPWEGGQDG